jgi:hypothetical protein
MKNSFYFEVVVPSDHGNVCYQTFDKTFIKFATQVFEGIIIRKNTRLDPEQCIELINRNRHKLGAVQELQLIADKMLNVASEAENKNLPIKISFIAE